MPRSPRDQLIAKYRQTLTMANRARRRCVNANGDIVPFVKVGRDTVANPYLAEWHRCVQQAASLARQLGIDGEEGEGGGALLSDCVDADYAAQLRAVMAVLARAIDECPGHGLGVLTREFREAAREYAGLRRKDSGRDPVARMVDAHRKARADASHLRAV